MRFNIKIRIFIFTLFFFSAYSIVLAQTGSSSNKTHPCTQEYLRKRVKQLMYEYINIEFPGLLNPDLSFSKNDGSVLNELMNDSLKQKITLQINWEFKDCNLTNGSLQMFSDANNQKKFSDSLKTNVYLPPQKKYGVLIYGQNTFHKFSSGKLYDVKVYIGDDGMYRYYSGEFSTQEEAYHHKVKLMNLGFRDLSIKLIEGQEIIQK